MPVQKEKYKKQSWNDKKKQKTQGQPSSSSPNSPWNDKRNTDVERHFEHPLGNHCAHVWLKSDQ